MQVTDRGRPVAILVRAMPAGLVRLEREGLLRGSEGDLLDVVPFSLSPGAVEPSRLISEARAD